MTRYQYIFKTLRKEEINNLIWQLEKINFTIENIKKNLN